MNDAELIATAALANVEAVLMAGDNLNRAMNGERAMWSSGCGMMEHSTQLADELHRRSLAEGAQLVAVPSTEPFPPISSIAVDYCEHGVPKGYLLCLKCDSAIKE